MSWGAVFAGLVVALVVQLVLSVLGLGLGLGAIDLTGAEGGDGGPAIGLAVGIWWIVSALVSLFLGGWVAGRLAGMPGRPDGLLHGVLVWGLATLVSVYLLTTAVGALIGGAVGVVTGGLSLAGQGVAAVVPAAADAVGVDLEGGADWEGIRREARQILRQTETAELRPDSLEAQARGAGQDARSAAAAAATDPRAAEEEMDAALEGLFERGEEVADAADREAVVNVLVTRTDMGRAEAERTVERWERTYRGALAEAEQAAADVRDEVVEAVDSAAGTTSEAALWAFLSMVLGLGAAAGGGALGSPRDIVAGVPANPRT